MHELEQNHIKLICNGLISVAVRFIQRTLYALNDLVVGFQSRLTDIQCQTHATDEQQLLD